ncbi:hypothetical protein HH310_35520 [Actinoplanes sp. TBRC 11911]|uniref:alpha/beta hydrolase n=1 Tax=Actinoplanes sp. TBRC 11911 TaxID=2729386 RepID=UPI00145F940D|nr:alpha/beta hydrolase [Actinoplanes sp. TBRC 11911]NMO56475.1 hypothetical protein [Actinoplanes sp. TBRC 11911]
MSAVYARLRVTDPGRWRALAVAWRRWAALADRLAAEFAPHLAGLGAAWSGTAATAAAGRLTVLRRRLVRFRLLCWRADQLASEFAAALERARALLRRALGAGLAIDDGGVPRGVVRPPGAIADLSAALAVAERADDVTAAGLDQLLARIHDTAERPAPESPGCDASPAEVRRWWSGLDPGEREWLLTVEPQWIGALDGVPAADRDMANRLVLADRRAELDRLIAASGGRERARLRGLRDGLDALGDRLATGDGPRAYLMRLDLRDEGRVVVAVGDPDRAATVLTHVPGMTAGLATFGGELSRAERVGERATEIAPAAATSAVLWLDYDAPDFLDEAATARRAEAGAPALRRFQEGLRATHDDPTGRQTVLGHSYGSLLVGKAAATPGLAADDVVFVGSPGVGVESVRDLAIPAAHVWSSTARGDVIQHLAETPGALARDLAFSAAIPGAGAAFAFGRPADDLWFGHNPSDPAFGARVFASQAGGGHSGYWDRGRPALDALAAITLGAA